MRPVICAVLVLLFFSPHALADAAADLKAAEKAERKGEPDKAMRLFNKALGSGKLNDKEKSRAHVGRGKIRMLVRRRIKSAIADFDQAVKHDPKNADAWRLRSRAHVRLSRRTLVPAQLGTAISDFAKYRALEPEDPPAKPAVGPAGYCTFACETSRLHCVRACAIRARKGVSGKIGAWRRSDFGTCAGHYCVPAARKCRSWCEGQLKSSN